MAAKPTTAAANEEPTTTDEAPAARALVVDEAAAAEADDTLVVTEALDVMLEEAELEVLEETTAELVAPAADDEATTDEAETAIEVETAEVSVAM